MTGEPHKILGLEADGSESKRTETTASDALPPVSDSIHTNVLARAVQATRAAASGFQASTRAKVFAAIQSLITPTKNVKDAIDELPILEFFGVFAALVGTALAAMFAAAWVAWVVGGLTAMGVVSSLADWRVRYLRKRQAQVTQTKLIASLCCAVCGLTVVAALYREYAEILKAAHAPSLARSALPSNPVTSGTTGLSGSLTYKLIHHKATPLPTTTPAPSGTVELSKQPLGRPPTAPTQPDMLLGVAARPARFLNAMPKRSPLGRTIALKGSGIVVQPDGQPLDPQLRVRFRNSGTTPISHLRAWLAPIYYDDLPKATDVARDLSQFDPDILGRPIRMNEFSIAVGETEPIDVDGFRPDHPLNGSGVQAIYVYYIYVDTTGILHEPEPSIFVFAPGLPGFTEIGIKDAFPDTWVRDALLQKGRQSVRYSDMLGEFGDSR